MFKYYKFAQACFVYLADAEQDPDLRATAIPELKHCRWFRRSWTLQELIAPRHLAFYDQNWNLIGWRNQLRSQISTITGIDAAALGGHFNRSTFSVAQRMSWAASRTATRTEDIAYALLGIFDVNMPLLYGEGDKAFTRLQEEIIKEIDDLSIFAWGDISTYLDQASRGPERLSATQSLGFLATSPGDFHQSAEVESSFDTSRDGWTVTNKGVRVSFPRIAEHGHNLILLDCRLRKNLSKGIAIPWQKRNGPQVRRTRTLYLLDAEYPADKRQRAARDAGEYYFLSKRH